MKILRKQCINMPKGLQCHASTILELSNGNMMCAFFGGTKEKAEDTAIYIAKCKDTENEDWSEPVVVAKVNNEEAHWNPVLFKSKSGKLFLFFKVGHSVPEWRTYFMTSFDEGLTWSRPEELVPGDVGGRGPVKNKPIQLSNGKIIAPASIEKDILGGGWYAFVDISEDDGNTWRKSSIVPQPKNSSQMVSVIQPTLWQSTGKNIHMLLRSTAGRIYRSDSYDEGETWEPMYPIELTNNNSGIDLVKLRDGVLVLTHNPNIPRADGYGGRNKLALSISNNNGVKWETLCMLEDDVELDENGNRIEYSYPAIILKNNNTICVSYTYRRKGIAIVTLAI